MITATPTAVRTRFFILLAGAGLISSVGLAGCTQDQGTDATQSPTAQSPGSSPDAADLAQECELPAASATQSPESRDFSGSGADSSALEVDGGENRALTGSTITKSGDSSSTDQSGFAGLNAAVLVSGGGSLNLADSTVESSGTGANGVFAAGIGSVIGLRDVTVKTDGSFAHAIDAAGGGAVTAVNTTLSTTKDNSSAIATGSGGGAIRVAGGSAKTEGGLSAVIYSTGTISVCALSGSSSLAEAAVIEGPGSVTTTGSDLTGGTRGAYISQSTPGAGVRGGGTFNMSGGTLTAQDGDAVFVDGVSTTIALSNQARLQAGSGNLISVSNNGSAAASLDETVLEGPVAADAGSALDLSLTANSRLTGTLSNVGLDLDNTSTVELTGDSSGTTVTGALVTGSSISNITGNGHTLTYDSTASGNAYLNGQDYDLAGGGQLRAS